MPSTPDADVPPTPPSLDAYPPREIAARIEQLGVTKARTALVPLIALSILAGAFISIGALLYTVVMTDPIGGAGVARWIGGLSFSVGLVLVVVAGAELFTGNNLIAMAWVSGRIGTREVLRNWIIVYAGNVVGCLGTVAIVLVAGTAEIIGGEVGALAERIASAKSELDFVTAFARGILCNALVCLAVWLAMGGRSVADKILAVIFPVAAFVALGFEHSIANWFFLPYGLALAEAGSAQLGGAITNLVAVTAGNIVGGTLLVAGVYSLAYRRGLAAEDSA